MELIKLKKRRSKTGIKRQFVLRSTKNKKRSLALLYLKHLSLPISKLSN